MSIPIRIAAGTSRKKVEQIVRKLFKSRRPPKAVSVIFVPKAA
jgi:hypothetical protein